MGKNSKVAVKHCQLHVGCDFLGSTTSLSSSRNADLEATSIGIRATSRKTKRVIVIPYSNVRGFELFPDQSDEGEKE